MKIKSPIEEWQKRYCIPLKCECIIDGKGQVICSFPCCLKYCTLASIASNLDKLIKHKEREEYFGQRE